MIAFDSKVATVPGKRISDLNVNNYEALRDEHSQEAAAAETGISVASARPAASAQALPSQRLRIALLGRFELALDGRTLRVTRHRSGALVAWLALYPGRQPRTRIAAALWPGSEAGDARRSLRVLLTEARRLLGEALLDGERDTLALDPKACAIDLLEVGHALRHAHEVPIQALQDAIRRAGEELLPGVPDAWLDDTREQLRSLRRQARLQLIERRLREADAGAAQAEAEALLADDPTDEAACRGLVSSLIAARQHVAALNRLEGWVRAMGRNPEPATQALRQRLMAAASSRPLEPGWLPHHASGFVGREIELNEVETLLQRRRLVTLVGPGGSGKSRLALQAAREIAHDYPGGAWWVNLSSLGDAAFVAHAVAARLGVAESGTQLLPAIVSRLGHQRTLLVMDTCEHVLDGAAHVVDNLLQACAGLQVLATSRQPLLVQGEEVWQTPGLSLPHPSLADWTDIADCDSVTLFVERARAAGAGHLDDPASLRAVAGLCIDVAGMPLALELAAAQCGRRSLDELRSGLHEWLSLARGPQADPASPEAGAQQRQHTLRSTIEWSWRLLPAPEQVLLRRLSVFQGGCTVEAAVAVTSGLGDGATPRAAPGTPDQCTLDVLPLDGAWIVRQALESLVRRALLQVNHRETTARFVMLDSVRAFAAEQCAAVGERAALQQTHLAYFEALANRCCAALAEGADESAKRQLEEESDNLDAALDAAWQHPGPVRALALTITLCRWWLPFCHYGKALHRLQQVLAAPLGPDAGMVRSLRLARLQAQAWLADVHYRRGEATQVLQHAQAALAGFEELGDLAAQPRAWYLISTAYWMVPDPPRALHATRRSLELARAAGDERGELYAINSLGEIYRVMRRGDEAAAVFEECIVVAQRRVDKRLEAVSVLNLGLSNLVQGRLRRAVTTLQSAARMAQAIRVNHVVSYAMLGLGQASLLAGQHLQALSWFARLDAFAKATDCAPLGPDAVALQASLQILRTHLAPSALEPVWAAAAQSAPAQLLDELQAFDATALPHAVAVADDDPILAQVAAAARQA